MDYCQHQAAINRKIKEEQGKNVMISMKYH